MVQKILWFHNSTVGNDPHKIRIRIISVQYFCRIRMKNTLYGKGTRRNCVSLFENNILFNLNMYSIKSTFPKTGIQIQNCMYGCIVSYLIPACIHMSTIIKEEYPMKEKEKNRYKLNCCSLSLFHKVFFKRKRKNN